MGLQFAAWGNSYIRHLCKLENLTEKVLITITHSVYNEQASPLFIMVNILKFRDLNDLEIDGIMFYFVNQNLSSTLLALFEYHAKGHGLNTQDRNYPQTTKISD